MLAEFRGKVAEAGLEQAALDALLERLVSAGLVKAGGKQRTDSTHVIAPVAALNRLEVAGKSVRAALAAAHPDWVAARICVSDWARRYGTPMTAWRPPASQARQDELAIAYARDGYALLEAVYAESSLPWLRELPAMDERLTVRDSSLSASTQAVIAAQTGHLDLAYDYLGEAALIDLRDLQHNTRDGLHLACLAGTWHALVSGFGGLRLEDGTVGFSPRLPDGLTRPAFTLLIGSRRLRVEVTHAQARYILAGGNPLEILHYGQPVSLTAGKPHVRLILAAPSRPRPSQPPGREPVHRPPGTPATKPLPGGTRTRPAAGVRDRRS